MLCELVRIPTLENQQDYLDKVYDWAKNEYTDEIVPSSQQRPRTASTRTRPLSAYSGKTRERVSRIPTATTRPGTTSKPQPIIQ